MTREEIKGVIYETFQEQLLPQLAAMVADIVTKKVTEELRLDIYGARAAAEESAKTATAIVTTRLSNIESMESAILSRVSR